MPASAEQLRVARSWIGTEETEAVFNERYDRLGSLDSAIEESMRAQLAVLIFDQPATMSTPDGLSAGFGDNIRAIQKALQDFIAIGGTDPDDEAAGGPGVTRLSRTSYR